MLIADSSLLYNPSMRPILLVFALTFAVPHTHAQTPDTEFTIITYNVQFLPGMASVANKRKQPEYRAQRIAEEVAGYDIVCLQETFHEAHRPILVDILQERWNGAGNLVIAPKPEGFYANGGTLIATRYPIVESHSFVYTQFSTPEEYGINADGYSAKGVIHARLQLPGDRLLDVFNTHLEAREPKFRPSQIRELADFIATHSDPAIPALLVGDMNTNGVRYELDNVESPYNHLLNELRRSRPDCEVQDLWPLLHPDSHGGTSEQESTDIGKRIDYILVLQPKEEDTALTPISVRVETYPDEQVEYLSDHNAVVARLKFASPN